MPARLAASRNSPPRKRQEHGFALLIVLWTLALLSLLISQLAGSGRQAQRLAGTMRTQAGLQAMADGAIQEAGYHVAAGGPAHWAANGVIHELRQGRVVIRLRILNEAGKINPSIASLELLAALVHGCDIDLPKATAIASAITAWRFPSGQGNYGADAYRQAGRSYMPPGQPFESLDEVGLVLGVTPPLLACMRPHLSLYRDTDPDPNAVDPVVRRALTETLGSPPPITDAAVDESVVKISVVATGTDGARAVRQATLRMESGQDASRSGDNGAAGEGPGDAAGNAAAPFRVLD